MGNFLDLGLFFLLFSKSLDFLFCQHRDFSFHNLIILCKHLSFEVYILMCFFINFFFINSVQS